MKSDKRHGAYAGREAEKLAIRGDNAPSEHVLRALVQPPANANAPPDRSRRTLGIALAGAAYVILASALALLGLAIVKDRPPRVDVLAGACTMAWKLLRMAERLFMPLSFLAVANSDVIRATTGQRDKSTQDAMCRDK